VGIDGETPAIPLFNQRRSNTKRRVQRGGRGRNPCEGEGHEERLMKGILFKGRYAGRGRVHFQRGRSRNSLKNFYIQGGYSTREGLKGCHSENNSTHQDGTQEGNLREPQIIKGSCSPTARESSSGKGARID